MISVLNQVADLWWSWMSPMFWQSSLLILLVGAVDRLIRKWAWPEIRHAMWILVFIKLIIPPAWSFSGALLPYLTEPARQAVEARLSPSEARSFDAGPTTISGPGSTQESTTAGNGVAPATLSGRFASARTGTTSPTWKVWAFLTWIFGMAAVTGLLITRTARLKKWHREQVEKRTVPPWFLDLLVSTAKKLKLERIPSVVFTDEIAAPAVYGVFQPVLLLPADSESLSRADAEHVLLHELAHLKRGDLWWHSLVLALQIVYWFNPLLIWARRQAKHVRELCCDLTVASILKEKTVEYRKTLLDTARRLLTDSPEPALALLGVFEEPFRLVARLRWLEKETWRRRTPALASAVMVIALGIPFILPMASAGPNGAFGVQPEDLPQFSGAREPVSEASPARPPSEYSGPAIFVRNEFHLDEIVLGFSIRSELVAVSETWVGQGIIAATERGKTVIIDRSRRMLTYIDHKHKFWTEIPLPLDLSTALCERSMQTRLERRSSGEVEPAGKTRRILGRKCREYSVHSWYVGDGRIHTEEFIKVWASEDMPFDLSLYDELLYNLRLIYNRDPNYRTELEKIKGLQMGIEMRGGNFFKGWRYADETVVLDERYPPTGTFLPPVGYERRERIEDLEF